MAKEAIKLKLQLVAGLLLLLELLLPVDQRLTEGSNLFTMKLIKCIAGGVGEMFVSNTV